MDYMQKKPSKASAVGHFFLAWVPLICFLGIQIIVSFVAMLIVTLKQMMPIIKRGSMLFNIDSMLQDIVEIYTGHIMEISLVYQGIALIVFVLWYYLYMGQKKVPNPVKMFTSHSILGIVVLGVSLEFFINGILVIVESIFPDIMKNYNELMEQAGINEVSVLVMLATILMAPVVEELVFRGVTYQIAIKINHSFWLANVIQALAFGIGHMNLVQGSYAFCLAIVMGCVYRKYKTIYATILMHAVFNFSGTVLTMLFGLLPIANNVIGYIVVMVIAALGCYLGYRIIRNDKINVTV